MQKQALVEAAGRLAMAVVFAAVIFPLAARAQNTGRQVLHGHIPAVIARFHLSPVGRLPATNRLNLAIGLPLQNEEALDDLLQQISDPASPNFRQYLTPGQFAEKFGPAEQDYQAVIAFAREHGFTVTGTSPNRMLLDVSGSVADVERAFHVTMRVYQHPTENRTFFAPDAEPSVDLATPILDISGLNDYSRPHPKYVISPLHKTTAGAPRGGVGSGPTGNYIGADFRAAYAPGVPLTGAGQTVALVQFDGYYLKDITNYEILTGLPNVPLQTVLLDGFNGTPTTGPKSGNIEVSLDIEMVVSMAPGVSQIILYEGNPTNFIPNDVLNCVATNDAASQISSSWGWNEGPNATTENIFKEMIAQGQTYFNASGDSDAFLPGALDNPSQINEPSSSTNIIQVGGTTLLATNPVSEEVWNWGLNNGSYVGSSGGISSSNAIPSWQTGISMTANHGSTTMRNVPDVALTADNVFVKYGNGLNATNVGGTSCAAPLWAGFTALVNQQAVAKGRQPVGFINPAIYAIGKSANYTADFNDVTAGNNFWPSSPTNFPAVPGYDLCTGWGTPNGMNLINALATPDALGITPGMGFSATGVTGGPFTISSQNFLLTNSGNASLNWSFISASNLFGASPSGGTLPVDGAATVAVRLSSTGSNLIAGIYSPTVTFSNQSSGIGQDRQFTLQIGQSVVQNGGFESGSFSSWTLFGDGIIGRSLYDGVVSSSTFAGGYGTNFIHSGNYGAALGEVGKLAYIYQTILTFPGQSYLISFWLNNPNGATPNQFVVNWNTNAPATNTIFNVSNIGVLNWTNMLFIATATGTNTTLQFGARNDNDYFGLDDVNVWPIPTPTIRNILKITDNAVAFTWNSLTDMTYQIQYSTNLATTNWFILSTNTATDFTLTVTNSIGTNSQCFFRIRRLP